MGAKNWLQKKLESFKDDFDFRLESLIYNITEKISIRLEQKSITRSQFADILHISPPAVTKLLNGNNNFTLKTLLSLSDALEFDLKIDFHERGVTAARYVDKEIVDPLLATEDDSYGYVPYRRNRPIKTYSDTNTDDTGFLKAA